MTVSRVVNGSGPVSPKLRARVEKALKDYRTGTRAPDETSKMMLSVAGKMTDPEIEAIPEDPVAQVMLEDTTPVLDIVDARTHQLVWFGSITREVRSTNPAGKRIEKAVSKLLKDFPPKK